MARRDVSSSPEGDADLEGREAPSRGSELRSWLVTFLVAFGVFALLRVFVIGVYYVPSGSMLDTINLGDQLIGEKVSYHFASPQAGDVVTFDDPDGSGQTLIKRVIATEGQVVDMRDGVLYIDGVAQSEDYTQGRPTYALEQYADYLPGPISYPYTVPAGCVWVMGDNRVNSLDSRYFGAVGVSTVTSHARFIYWPLTDIRGL